MPELLSLPNELLQHIASFSTCSSVFSLLRVNHQLRNACNDRLVFHSIARRDLTHIPGDDHITRPCSQSESILASGSLSELTRLAFAAEKGIEASLAKDHTWTLDESKRSSPSNLSNWLPQILILRHSAALQIKPETFVELQGTLFPQNDDSPIKNDFCAVNFIISYLILNRIPLCLTARDIKQSLDLFFSENPSTGPPITTGEDDTHNTHDSIDYLRHRVPSYAKHEQDFSLNQATALLPALILELATCHLDPQDLDWLPSPSRIPFSSILDMPALFQTHANPPFAACHMSKMATQDFLSGNWAGFYSDQRVGISVRSYDAPMQDIQIVTRAPSTEGVHGERVAVTIDRATRGVDAHGEFLLQGYVTESGFVDVMKQYIVARWSWSWMGRLTPFGIVRVWRGGYDYFGGYFWIWKREWCEK